MNDLYLTEAEASLRYKYSKFWFQRCRWIGNGPAFIKIRGKILYPLEETDAWFNNNIRYKSTSEFNKKEMTNE
jgi:hypothetical protein